MMHPQSEAPGAVQPLADLSPKSAPASPDTATLDAASGGANPVPGARGHGADSTVTRDFGFLPIPRYLRYEPDRPVHFGIVTNVMLGMTGTFILSNVYYCQPILINLATTFDVSYDKVSTIPTVVQAGYVLGLITIAPVGDLVRRRPLVLLLAAISATLTIGVAVTHSIVVFEIISFFVGVFSVTPQILLPMAADLAPPERRASAISIVLGAFLFGILFARVLSGTITQFVSWRVVYYMAVGLQCAALAGLYWLLPDYPAKDKEETYLGILWSLVRFAFTEPLLFQAALVSVCASGVYTSFWVTLTFLLGEAPYNYSTLVIGLFGLIGMFGVALVPLAGRIIDALVPWFSCVVSICFLLVFQALQVGAGGVSVAAVVIACVGLDVFRQMQQVALTSAVFGLDPKARSRLNAVVLIAMCVGQVMGTSVNTRVFNAHGWRAAAWVSFAWTAFTLVVMLARGPHVPRYAWFGYQGGCAVLKRRVARGAEDACDDVEAGGEAQDGAEDVDEKRCSEDKKDHEQNR